MDNRSQITLKRYIKLDLDIVNFLLFSLVSFRFASARPRSRLRPLSIANERLENSDTFSYLPQLLIPSRS